MNMRRFFILLILAVAASFAATDTLQGQVHSSSAYRYLISKEEILRHLEFLTSEEIAGRAAGTPQAKQVADYIAGEFEEYGLQTFRSVSFYQPFTLPAPKGGSTSGLSGRGSSYTEQYKRVTGESSGQVNKGYNVVGYLPAKEKNAGYIIIGAHFDHIGSIDGKFYPGADDNASGVAALLELAKTFGKRYVEKDNLNHNIVFVAFDGNNFSLAGSRHFASRLGIAASQITCMLNLDQMGSTLAPVGDKEEYLLVLGSNKLKGWQQEQLEFANGYFGLGLHLDFSYYGSPDFYDIFYKLSDQQSFTERGIPALLFTSGITKLTNKEGDRVESLDLEVLKRRIELVYRFVWLIE